MSKILNIAVDAMGGEGSPKKAIDGIIHHSKSTENINYNIFGDEKEIKEFLKDLSNNSYKIFDTKRTKLVYQCFLSFLNSFLQ